MSWNYRIIDHGSHIALHEVYYHADGQVKAWSAEPTGFVSDHAEGLEALVLSLERALDGARDKTVLLRADLPGE